MLYFDSPEQNRGVLLCLQIKNYCHQSEEIQ